MSQTFRTAYRAASKAYVREMNLNTRTLDIDVYRGHFPLRSQTQKNTENLGVLHATSLEQATRFFIDPVSGTVSPLSERLEGRKT